MGMSEFYGARHDADSLRVMSRAVERGIDFFDTADMYGPLHNETLIGRFLAETRAPIRIASKFGIVRQPGEYARHIDNRPEYAREACEASLRRLGVERIDLYYVHRLDRDQPIEETIDGLAALVRAGKIGGIGLCEVSAATLRRAHAVHPITAVQTEYSLWSREVEREVLPTCRELGVGVVPYSPLGRGFLAGRFTDESAFDADDFRPNLPRFTPSALAANRPIAETVERIAADKECSAAQLSLAWLLAQGTDILPIPGTKRLTYLEENAASLDIRLSDTECRALEEAVSATRVEGARYSAEGMKGVDA